MCFISHYHLQMIIGIEIIVSYYGGFVRFDSSGNMNFLKIFSSNTQITQAAFFQSSNIISFSNSGFILSGKVVSSLSTIGYSQNSSTDQAVIKIDQSGNTVWTTVLDYNLGYDFADTITKYESTVYVGMYAKNLYPWFISLNGADGDFLQSAWFTYFYNDDNDQK